MTAPDSLPHLADLPLLRSLARHRWLMLLRGVAAVLFGILAVVWPGITGLTLVLLWGVYAFADGVLALWGAIAGGGAATGSRWWLAIVGVLGVVAGLIAFFMPALTAGVLLILIAVWAIAIGVMEIVGASQLRKEIENEWLLILSGVLAILFGILMFAQPASGALAVIWIIAIFAIVFGIDLILLAFKLRRFRRTG